MQKLILFLSLITLLACEGDIYMTFEWKNMEPFNATNETEYPTIFEGDSLPASIYCIQLNMFSEIVYEEEGRYYDTEHPPTNRNQLTELTITSTADFGDAYPSGTNLTRFFQILNGSYYSTIPADGSEGYDINNASSHQFRSQPDVALIDLLLLDMPILGETHVFTVECTLEYGPILTGETNPIKLY